MCGVCNIIIRFYANKPQFCFFFSGINSHPIFSGDGAYSVVFLVKRLTDGAEYALKKVF